MASLVPLSVPRQYGDVENSSAGRGRASEKPTVMKRPSVLPEKSCDSSAFSGVSSLSRGGSPPLSKASPLTTDFTCQPAKRPCMSQASSAGLRKKWSEKLGKEKGSLARVESEITSAVSNEGMQEAVEDPGNNDSAPVDPAELVSWPDSALDFNLDPAGEIEDNGKGIGYQAKRKAPGTADQPNNSKRLVVSAKECHQDSLSESAADVADGPESSEQLGTEGTSSDGAKSGKGTPPAKRKVKVDWTPDLHRRFVQAVEQLGVEKAIPSRILEIMNVKCLTRHNIASHLQKYRSHRRHLAAREAEAANWQQQRKAADGPLWPAVAKPGAAPYGWAPFPGSMPAAPPHAFAPGVPAATPVPGRPVMGMPPPGVVQGVVQGIPMGAPQGAPVMGQPHQPALGTPAMGMPMQVWGHPTADHSQAHMWQRPGYPMPPPAWYGPDGSLWHYPGQFQPAPSMDMWGNPVASYPGAGMVSGMPCFMPQPMQMQGIPQRIPSGASTSSLFAAHHGSPAAGLSACNINTGAAAPSPATPPTPGSAASAAACGTAAALGEDLSEADDSLDAFLDEALPDSMFAMPDELAGFGGPANLSESCSDVQAASMLDAAISEALANPSTPLPLGLKPPSVDGVLEELNKQGFSVLPPFKGCSEGLDIKAEFLGDEALGEVDDHALVLAGAMGEGLEEDALNALLEP